MPYEKGVIKAATLKILRALKTPKGSRKVQRHYRAAQGQDLSMEMISSLEAGLLTLANFMPKEDAEICIIQLLNTMDTRVLQQLSRISMDGLQQRKLSRDEFSRFSALQATIINEQNLLIHEMA